MNALNFSNSHRAPLLSPHQLFAAPQPLPPRSPQNNFNSVSSLLGQRATARPDQVQLSLPALTPLRPTALQPLFGNNDSWQAVSRPAASRPAQTPRLSPLARTQALSPNQAVRSQQIQQIITDSGLKEWRSGVRETQGSNKSPRINQYARNAKFGPGYEWCGFFTAWNYSQAGFKHPEDFASYQKARDFFLYRSYTSRDSGLHQRLDNLRAEHKAEGSSRQYFIMPGSPTEQYVKNYSRFYGHVDLPSMTHSWRNLPIQPGDIALFSHGHIGQVVSYDPSTGKLETVEGNTSGKGPDGKNWSQALVRKSYDLSKESDRKRFDGFGRAALGDFA